MKVLRGVFAAAILCATTTASFASSALDYNMGFPKLTASYMTIHFDATTKLLTIDGSLANLIPGENATPTQTFDVDPGTFAFSAYMVVDNQGQATPDTAKPASLQIYGSVWSNDPTVPDPGDVVFANSTVLGEFAYGRNANSQVCFAFTFGNPSASAMVSGFPGYSAYTPWVDGGVFSKVFVQDPAADPNFLYDFTYNQNVKADIVPLPGAWALGGVSLLALAGIRRVRRASR